MKLQKQAFTLVELIVVITILAILGTIAFISLQGFSRDARDSARISDLKSIEKGFELLLTQDQSLPQPEDYVEISASGTTISYQGYAGEKVMGTAKVFGGGKDPLDDTYYTYVTDTKLRNYELMGFLENGEQIALNTNLLKQTQATDYSTRHPIIKGKPLGIIVDPTTKEPIQAIGSGVDIVNTNTEYAIVMGNNNIVIGTGSLLFSKLYNGSDIYLKKRELASLDHTLLTYLDFDEISNGIIHDYSRYSIDGTKNNYSEEKYDGDNGYLYFPNNINYASYIYGRNTIYDSVTISIGYLPNLNIEDSSIKFLIGTNHYNSNINVGIRYNSIDDKISYQDYNNHQDNRIATTPNGSIIRGKWNIITLVYDYGKVSLYINGKLLGYADGITMDNKNVAENKVLLGGLSHNGISRKIEGGIDNVRIYNRALSKYEVEMIYKSSIIN